MGSLIGELEARQAAVHSRAAELEEEIAALTARLEAERERPARLTVTREGWPNSRPRGSPSMRPRWLRRWRSRWAGARWWCRRCTWLGLAAGDVEDREAYDPS